MTYPDAGRNAPYGLEDAGASKIRLNFDIQLLCSCAVNDRHPGLVAGLVPRSFERYTFASQYIVRYTAKVAALANVHTAPDGYGDPNVRRQKLGGCISHRATLISLGAAGTWMAGRLKDLGCRAPTKAYACLRE